jgi:hypothetical protein
VQLAVENLADAMVGDGQEILAGSRRPAPIGLCHVATITRVGWE